MDWKAKWICLSSSVGSMKFGVGTIAGVGRRVRVHRRVVRRAIAVLCHRRTTTQTGESRKAGRLEAFIDRLLDEDRRAPRKQRHDRHRIYRRILAGFPTPLSEIVADATTSGRNTRWVPSRRRRSVAKLQLG